MRQGPTVARRDLTGEAFFLARLVTELLPTEPEGLGLLALMLHAEARRRARRSDEGDYVPLADQDVARWDLQMIDEAEALLLRAQAFGVIGRYQLEAAVQSAHVHRRRTGHANWEAVLRIYDALFTITGSPVVAINRALVVAELQGAHAALEAMPDPTCDSRLVEYQPYWAARAELLANIGAYEDARHAYEIAIGLERDPRFAVSWSGAGRHSKFQTHERRHAVSESDGGLALRSQPHPRPNADRRWQVVPRARSLAPTDSYL